MCEFTINFLLEDHPERKSKIFATIVSRMNEFLDDFEMLQQQ
jgi:hypothetical protein